MTVLGARLYSRYNHKYPTQHIVIVTQHTPKLRLTYNTLINKITGIIILIRSSYVNEFFM